MKIKKLLELNDENKTKILGLLTILILLWLLLYFIPEVFVSLFNTLLGNLILVISLLLVYMNNRLYGLGVGLIMIILYRFFKLSKVKESFTMNITGTFNIQDTEQEEKQKKEEERKIQEQQFLLIQNTLNRNTIFDINIIRSQASQKELEYFNKNGKWPWSKEVIELYQEAIRRNPYVRTVPEQATNYARTIYNEAAIVRLLSYETKEGQFLLNGILIKDPSGNKMEELPSGFGNFPYEAGLLENRTDDIIKCNIKNENNPFLERIRYTGKGWIYGEQTQQVTPVNYNDLEKIIPGFSFVNKPCNPCGNIAANPDYSCAFNLKVKDKPSFISNIWKYIWKIQDNPFCKRRRCSFG